MPVRFTNDISQAPLSLQMSHIDCTEQVLLIWCAAHCAGVPARQVFLAPDLDDSSHGGEANALSAPTPALNAAFVCSLLSLILDAFVLTL